MYSRCIACSSFHFEVNICTFVKYSVLPLLHWQFGDAINALIVCNIADYSAYEDAAIWLNELRIHPNIVIMLVGNQCDLKHHRVLSTEEAKEYAEENSAMFMETSAKDGTNVEAEFLNLVTIK